MKSSVDVESPVIITLDETLKSPLLYRKFTCLTTEFQLFLQHTPVLYWYPLDLLGTTTTDIDACIFSAAIRNHLHKTFINTEKLLLKLLKELPYINKERSNLCKSIYTLKSVNHDNWDIRQQRLKRLLIGLLDDELFFLELVSIDCFPPVKCLSDRLRKNLQFLTKILISYVKSSFILQKFDNNSMKPKHDEEENGNLEELTDEMKDNETIMLNVIKRNPLFLEFASDRLKDNEQIVLEAIRQDGDALQFASNRLRNNEEIVLEADDIRYASKRLRNNEEFIKKVLKTNGTALKYAPARLKDNEEIVLAHLESFEFASKRLKDKEYIVLEATKQRFFAFRNASKRLKDNYKTVLQVVKQDGIAIAFASKRLKDNEQIVLEAVKKYISPFMYASERLRNDMNFISEVFKRCNSCYRLELFEHCGKEVRNIEFIHYFIKENLSSIREIRRK